MDIVRYVVMVVSFCLTFERLSGNLFALLQRDQAAFWR